MSDVLTNASRYNTSNSARIDGSAVFANTDGNLMGEFGVHKNGNECHGADSSSTDRNANKHQCQVDTSGKATQRSAYQPSQISSGLTLAQALNSLTHRDQTSDSAFAIRVAGNWQISIPTGNGVIRYLENINIDIAPIVNSYYNIETEISLFMVSGMKNRYCS